MFQGKSLALLPLAEGLVELRFDRSDAPVNKLDARTMGELSQALRILAGHADARGLLVTSAKDVFIVGADIHEFAAIFGQTREELVQTNLKAKAVLTALEDLPIPSVAAINGFALGGGLELALAADSRVMATSARVGLPEVGLGIYPAYGGTVRISRIAPLATALEWVAQGATYSAQAAYEVGVVDSVADTSGLRDLAMQRLQDALNGGWDWRAQRQRKLQALDLAPAALDEILGPQLARARVQAQRSHLPAAVTALEMMRSAVMMGRDAALRLEAEVFPDVAQSEGAVALVRIYLDEQSVKKSNRLRAQGARDCVQTGVVGAGIMGSGIAFSMARSGVTVRLADVSQAQLDKGRANAIALLERQQRAGRLNAAEAQAILASLQFQVDHTGFESVDLVVEAVSEQASLKHTVLQQVESTLRDEAVIATNTSSLRVTEIASALRRPERFVGMHFFNPVPAMPLVEIIRGERTNTATLAAAVRLAQRMGKTPIVVADCPGFLVNRIVTPYLRAFVRLVAEGVDPYAVDAAMEGYGWPMGPAMLEDVVGLDTGSHVLHTIAQGYAHRLPDLQPDVLATMASRGILGQKVGAGFYLHPPTGPGSASARRSPNPAMAEVLELVQASGKRQMQTEEIVHRMMLPLWLEAARCLEEGVVDTAAELDLAVLLGLGYPRWTGGPLQQIDRVGFSVVQDLCARHAELGLEYQCTPEFLRRAAMRSRFHGA